jgi:hypothetical protein
MQRLLPNASNLLNHPSFRLVGTHEIPIGILGNGRQRMHAPLQFRMAIEPLQEPHVLVNRGCHLSRSYSAAVSCSSILMQRISFGRTRRGDIIRARQLGGWMPHLADAPPVSEH